MVTFVRMRINMSILTPIPTNTTMHMTMSMATKRNISILMMEVAAATVHPAMRAVVDADVVPGKKTPTKKILRY